MQAAADLLKIPWVRWQSIVDFIVLSTTIYWLLDWARQTRVLRFFVGIGGMILAGSVARRLDLVVTAWILHMAAIAAVVLLVVVYHTEIGHALTRLDPLNRLMRSAPAEQLSDRTAIAEAVFSLASVRRGALIVLTGNDLVWNTVNGGVPLGGSVSKEILEAIFRKLSPLHDGAVIVENGRIARVGVYLPLSHRENLPRHYGTRHRAAIGLAEQCDARVIVVSEERGEVSLFEGTTVHLVQNCAQLVELMEGAGHAPPLPPKAGLLARLSGNLSLKLSAVGIACLIWVLVFLSGSSVRTFMVPVEFGNLPAGLEVSEPVNDVLAVQLRAATRLFATLDESQLVVRVDLLGMKEGVHNVEVEAANLNLPPGIFLEQAVPDVLKVQLVPRSSSRVQRPPPTALSSVAKGPSARAITD
jgi:diadenylate cyclase